jgi:hypothetical protein
MIRKLFESVRGTLWGCAVAILVFLVLVAIEMALLTVDLKLNLKTYSWLIAVCAGGVFACRQAKSSPWLNCTIFAVLLELLVATQIPDANQTLSKLYPNADPAAIHWHYPTMIALTIPAVLAGSLIWVFTIKRAEERTTVNDTANHS